MNAIDEIIAAAEAEAKSGKRTDICGCGTGTLHDVAVMEQVMVEEDGTSIAVEVPAVRCDRCGATYTDHRAEPVRRAAVCRHFGLLTPEEIRAIRTSLDISRPKFSEAFGIPTASLERWENGRLMQNDSMDTLLRVIGRYGLNVGREALKLAPIRVLGEVEKTTGHVVEGNVVWARFPSLAAASEEKRTEVVRGNGAFDLRRQA
jgi:putative zinc finger/helix-turn-helix YgiT family protein